MPIHIEQFVTALRPSWVESAAGGDLPFAPRTGKGHHKNLHAPGFRRSIGQPVAIRRKRRRKSPTHPRNLMRFSRFPCFVHWEAPDLAATPILCREPLERQDSAVRRPGGWIGVQNSFRGQRLLFTRSIGAFPVDGLPGAARRAARMRIGEPLAVRRPLRPARANGAKHCARRSFSLQVIYPNVSCTLLKGEPLSIRRKAWHGGV